MINRLPSWFVVGILIYPLLILVGLIFSLATSGDFNFMYWLYMPSIMFDQLFKECCQVVANSQKIILFAGFLFWFFIGAILGLIVRRICAYPLISREEMQIEENREKELETKPEEKKEEASPVDSQAAQTEASLAPVVDAETKSEEPKAESPKEEANAEESKETVKKEDKKSQNTKKKIVPKPKKKTKKK